MLLSIGSFDATSVGNVGLVNRVVGGRVKIVVGGIPMIRGVNSTNSSPPHDTLSNDTGIDKNK